MINTILNIVFLSTLLLVATLAIFGHLTKRYKNFTNYGPSLLISIGVLGTFVGISLGLFQFNTSASEIQNSISNLLESLKLAFWTSVGGMFLSIIVKIVQSIYPNEDESFESKIYTLFEIISHNTKVILKIESLYEKNSKKLFEEFNQFENIVAVKAYNAFLSAMKEVTKNFNDKLVENLGDNFKEFNLAIDEIRTWQRENKQQIKELSSAYNDSLIGIENLRSLLSMISAKSELIPDTLEKIREIGNKYEEQIQDLRYKLESFVILRNQAKEAFPIIEQNLLSLTSGLEKTITNSLGIFNASLESQKTSFLELEQGFSHMKDTSKSLSFTTNTIITNLDIETKSILEHIGATSSSLNISANRLSEEIERSSFENISTSIVKLLEGTEKEVGTLLTTINKNTNANLAALRKEIEIAGEQRKTIFSTQSDQIEKERTIISQTLNQVQERIIQLKSEHDSLINMAEQERSQIFGGIKQSIEESIKTNRAALEYQYNEFSDRSKKELEIMTQTAHEILFNAFIRLIGGVSDAVAAKQNEPNISKDE